MKILNTLEHSDTQQPISDGFVATIQRLMNAKYEVQCDPDYQLVLSSIPHAVVEAAGLQVPFKRWNMEVRDVHLHGATVFAVVSAENDLAQFNAHISLDPVDRTATIELCLIEGGLNDLGED